MLAISKPLYVYLQRPDNGDWVTVGRYLAGPAAGSGKFRYAPSYVEAGLTWAIDPVNLPFRPEEDRPASRYNGLHDVLRDACPDAWGQALLRREHNLPEGADMARYLLLAGNTDRWGALAIGTRPAPPVAQLSTPKLLQLPLLVRELAAMSEQRPAVDRRLRRRLRRQWAGQRLNLYSTSLRPRPGPHLRLFQLLRLLHHRPARIRAGHPMLGLEARFLDALQDLLRQHFNRRQQRRLIRTHQ
jgi:hypothetical protein